MATIKLSIIFLYHRLFPLRQYTYILLFCAMLVIAWLLIGIITPFVECHPIHYFWDRYIDENAKGSCYNIIAFYMGNSISGMLMDVMLLILPIPIICRLQMSLNKKLAISCILLLGGFVCISSVVRIYYISRISKSNDFTWVMKQPFIWSCVEPCLGIIAACLVPLWPFFRYVQNQLFRWPLSNAHQNNTENVCSVDGESGLINRISASQTTTSRNNADDESIN
ncbi:uncharacterized protein N7458_004310 [Penicillium daleae]|uniref:Rhodopsin domain-containing protein n=1 Tax=Penicillium daleae TaxID=63821 RepID=A0AAD6C9Y2_9EURO|nr:uncharacterized protein N7458_004310 [Penicillium daleae]KAJ5456046.1 hypothetical protein N7458_004310 [Penicillium daleae]